MTDRSVERLQSLIECLPDWLWEVDARGVYTHSSPQVHDLLGYTPEEVVGRTPFEFMPPEEAQRVGGVFADAVARREPLVAIANINVRKDGTRVVLETSGRPFFSADGELLGYRGIDRDITERMRAAEKLRESEERLRELSRELRETTTQLIQTTKLTALGELAAGVTHDLKQPLNGIAIIAQTLARYPEDYGPEELRGELREILTLVESMTRIIDHMRLFVRQSSERELRELDVNAVLQRALFLVEQQLKDHDAEVRRELAPSLPAIMGDGARLEQAFLNLVVNAGAAFEATARPDKRLTIRTGVVDEPPGTIVVEIEDNGVGIPVELQEKIFQPFFTTKAPGKGTGLGLSIVRKIIEEHGGRLELRSTVGEGTTFRLLLPQRPPEASAGGAELPE